MNDVEKAEGVLADVLERGGDLRVDGSHLRLRVPNHTMDDDLRTALGAHRDEIIARLGTRWMIPLSAVQRRLWFLQHLDSAGTGYEFAFVYRLRGELDPRALDIALRATVAAHPALRACFEEIGGTPAQFIVDSVGPETVILDCRGRSEQDTHTRLREHLIRPIDLCRPPLLGAVLARTGEDEWLWGLAYHHLVADGWSHSLLLRGVCAAYRGEPVAPPEADYRDFVAAEHATNADPSREAALAHWADVLRTGMPGGELPLDAPRPEVRTYRGGRVDSRIDAATADALRALAAEERTTLYSVLLSVHATMVAKHATNEKVIVGTPHASRSP